MIKKIFIFQAVLLFTLSAIAQGPTIEGTYLPVKNTTFKQIWDTTATLLTIPTTGANQVWNYSNKFIQMQDTFHTKTIDKSGLPYYHLFPDATHASFWNVPLKDQDSLFSYFIVDTSGFHRIGGFSIMSTLDSVFIEPSELFMPARVKYNMDTIFNYSRTVGYGKSGNYKVKSVQLRNKQMVGAGYGTLITPLGSFSDVVLMKEINYRTDSVFVDFGGNGNYSFYQKYNYDAIYYHFLRNNTFATTHLMLLKCSPFNNFVWYGWYTLPVDFGSIEGFVYDTTGLPVTNGEVYLYREYSNFTKNDILAITPINTNGSYKFDSIPYGEYRIAARPDLLLYPNSFTTYYGDTTDWKNAQSIITTNNVNGINITLDYHDPNIGNNTISGKLLLNYNYNRIGQFGKLMKNDPIPGIDIIVEKKPSGPVKSSIQSNNSGDFTISNLENGTYTLWVDMPGLNMSGSYTFTLSGSTTVSELDFTVGKDSIHPFNATYVVKQDIKENGFSVFPNPSDTKVNIAYTLDHAQNVSFKIVNILGETIREVNLGNKLIGSYNYVIDSNELKLNSGTYLLQMNIGSMSKTKKFSILK